jgi:hypothetical protein
LGAGELSAQGVAPLSLTDTAVRNAKPGEKPVKLFDGGGLYLEVSPAGGKWWRLKYRFGGKEKRLSLGVYPDVSLKDARNRRDESRKLLASGIDAIFHKLARKATHSEYLNQLEVHLRLALKAQSQCRATLETLAAIKNPQPVAFVRQANIAHGPQQVNNCAAQPCEPTRAGEFENLQNKLLETQNGEGVDTGAQGATGDLDSALETVAAIHRPEDIGR